MMIPCGGPAVEEGAPWKIPGADAASILLPGPTGTEFRIDPVAACVKSEGIATPGTTRGCGVPCADPLGLPFAGLNGAP